ncbi:uncharacterized protein [Rutidosis leptorrhynchoides]|uniref:uncharacterized protein n=1 Tax=Rutidosis leptorrhynchoides TaxID=125765 RepID=UPI003A9A55BF
MGRIPVRVELDKRDIDLDTVRCPNCDGDIETVGHIILNCPLAKDLWSRVVRWWNGGAIQYSGLDDMFIGKSSGSNSNVSKLWQAIEWVCGYVLWKNRNLKVFEKKVCSVPMAFNEIQSKSFLWISSRAKNLQLDWNSWLLQPNVFDNHG